MRFLTCILFSLLTATVFAQTKDTIYKDSLKELALKSRVSVNIRPLILIDDFVYNGLLEDIDANTVVSIDVLKSMDAKQIYGELADNGAILITTYAVESFGSKYNLPVEKETLLFNPKKTPLIVMDGFIYTGSASDIGPKDILSFYSLGQPGATNIYGEQGKNGALLIKTFSEGKQEYQISFGNISMAYRIYLEANKGDDSGLLYVLNGAVLEGSQSEIITKLDREAGNIKAVVFVEKSSEKFNTNNQKPMVVIMTKK